MYDRNRKFGRNFRIQQFSVYESEVGKNLSKYLCTYMLSLYLLFGISFIKRLHTQLRIEVLISAEMEKKIKYGHTMYTAHCNHHPRCIFNSII